MCLAPLYVPLSAILSLLYSSPNQQPGSPALDRPQSGDPSYGETAGVSSASFTLELEGGKLYILQVLDESYSENAKDTTVTITIN